MRVLLFTEWLEGLGGCEHFAVALADALRDRDVEVLVAVARGPIHARWSRALESTSGSKVEVLDVPRSAGGDAAAEALARLVDRLRPDLIHAIPYEKTTFAYVRRADAIPVVGTEPSDGGERCYWWYAGDVLRRTQSLFRGLHVFSSRAARNVRRVYGYQGPVARIPPICRFDIAEPLWRRRRPANAAASLGRLAVEKGLGFAIDTIAAQSMSARAAGSASARGDDGHWPRLRLEIWGDGPLGETLRTQAVACGLGERVLLRGGFTSFFEVPLDGIDFVLLPSYFEGLPFVLLESLWRGLPVVVTDRSGAPDLLADDGTLFELVTPGDQASLVAAVDRIYNRYRHLADDASRRRELVARHCDPGRCAAAFIELYQEALR